MDVREFFKLPEDQRDLLANLHRKQKGIRRNRELILDERKQLDTREINNQLQCEHPFAEFKYKAHENEYGNMTGGGVYYYHCEDCGKRWQQDRER